MTDLEIRSKALEQAARIVVESRSAGVAASTMATIAVSVSRELEKYIRNG